MMEHCKRLSVVLVPLLFLQIGIQLGRTGTHSRDLKVSPAAFHPASTNDNYEPNNPPTNNPPPDDERQKKGDDKRRNHDGEQRNNEDEYYRRHSAPDESSEHSEEWLRGYRSGHSYGYQQGYFRGYKDCQNGTPAPPPSG
jgi:hypothetical protein